MLIKAAFNVSSASCYYRSQSFPKLFYRPISQIRRIGFQQDIKTNFECPTLESFVGKQAVAKLPRCNSLGTRFKLGRIVRSVCWLNEV